MLTPAPFAHEPCSIAPADDVLPVPHDTQHTLKTGGQRQTARAPARAAAGDVFFSADQDAPSHVRVGAMGLVADNLQEGLTRDELSRRSLHIAAEIGDTDFVRKLIDSGDCYVDVPDHEGRTALHLAAAHGHIHTAEVLLSLGANIAALDKHNKTPLMIAALHTKYDLAMRV